MFQVGFTTDQFREGVSPVDKRSTRWTTMVGHIMSAMSERRSENQGRGGKGEDVVQMCRPSSKDDRLLHCHPYS